MKLLGLLYVATGVTFVFMAVAGALTLLVYVGLHLRDDEGVDVGLQLILEHLDADDVD